MDRVTVYLRTSLFTINGDDAHLPTGVMVLEGHVEEQKGGSVTVNVSGMSDMKGKSLSDKAAKLQVPWSKIDHLVIHED